MTEKVKVKRRRGFTRLSRKNQATIPVDVVAASGLRPGDELEVRAVGPGRVLLARAGDNLDEYVGDLTGVYGEGYLEDLRAEWD
ncbi:MAG TPA: AbrB/MazE/SpoVT family DNA-binding domain-containing protein [Actinomycetota bacterium]